MDIAVSEKELDVQYIDRSRSHLVVYGNRVVIQLPWNIFTHHLLTNIQASLTDDPF